MYLEIFTTDDLRYNLLFHRNIIIIYTDNSFPNSNIWYILQSQSINLIMTNLKRE